MADRGLELSSLPASTLYSNASRIGTYQAFVGLNEFYPLSSYWLPNQSEVVHCFSRLSFLQTLLPNLISWIPEKIREKEVELGRCFSPHSSLG